MFLKNSVLAALVFSFVAQHGSAAGPNPAQLALGGPVVNSYTTIINDLFQQAITARELMPQYADTTGCFKLMLEPYPDFIRKGTENSATPEKCDDGSSPLRLRSHNSRHRNQLCSYLVHLTITNIQVITSLDFLMDQALNPEFKKCLFSLEVSNCGLTTLDLGLFKEYANLSRLDLHNNRISQLDSSTGIPPLESLDLSNNFIADFGVFFTPTFRWLEFLSLAGNRLTALPADCLTGLLMLNQLNLSNNALADINLCNESFARVGSNFPHFQLSIDLSGNQLTCIPYLYEQRERLTSIDMTNNQVTVHTVPSYFPRCSIRWVPLVANNGFSTPR